MIEILRLWARAINISNKNIFFKSFLILWSSSCFLIFKALIQHLSPLYALVLYFFLTVRRDLCSTSALTIFQRDYSIFNWTKLGLLYIKSLCCCRYQIFTFNFGIVCLMHTILKFSFSYSILLYCSRMIGLNTLGQWNILRFNLICHSTLMSDFEY